jgi:hypothetical protein
MKTKKVIFSNLGVLPNGKLSNDQVKMKRKMKKIGILLLLVLANSVLVDAQETYRFTFKPRTLKKDTITVYDEKDNAVLMYGKDIFVYRQTPITVSKNKKERVFSSPAGELGRASSKRYRNISLADGSTYELAPGMMKLAYKKDGRICARAEYYCGSYFPYTVGNEVDVEMSVDTDTDFTPFLFQSVLAHINVTRSSELSFWLSWTAVILASPW